MKKILLREEHQSIRDYVEQIEIAELNLEDIKKKYLTRLNGEGINKSGLNNNFEQLRMSLKFIENFFKQ